ncbi:snapc4 protein, putative [Ixodes scapularis]|uniref:Snapc4 protein, putative n=1 Tax=Ixodes scapularis TaxID=6945 RepID=B7PJF0_IXOSC|nr:snapc4 protein, putative [Ixodes scapularis]|eukprot:XP_002407823.1 snapc4 protein, putative [Ixodes scapularis]
MDDGDAEESVMTELRPLQIDTLSLEVYEGSSNEEQDDGDDDDDDDESLTGSGFVEVPNNLENCLELNRAYREILTEAIGQLTVTLENNRQLQRELPKQLAERVNRPTMPTHRKNWHHGLVFHHPYFRDINGMRPPPNQDEVTKRQNREQDPYLDIAVRWSTEEIRMLVNGVRNSLLQQLIESLMDRKEAMAQRLLAADERGDDMISEKVSKEELTERIRVIDGEIEQAKAFELRQLLNVSTRPVDWLRISAVDMGGMRSAFSCEMNWKHLHDDELNRGPWTSAEDDRLRKITAKWQERCWDEVSLELRSGRSAFQCARRYWGHLVHRYRHGSFTQKEDDLLMRLVEACSNGDSIPWAQVAHFMGDRSMKQLMNRYERSIAPHRRLGRWTPEEDLMLLAAVANMLPGRHTVQCKERYTVRYGQHQVFGQFTPEEDRLLLEALQKHGKNNWTKVAQEMQTRSANSVMLRHRRLRKILGVADPQPEDLVKLPPADPSKRTTTRRKTSLDRRRQLTNTICQRLASQRHRTTVSSLAMGKEDLEREECMRLYEQLMRKHRQRKQYSATKQAHILNRAIARYARIPSKAPRKPNLAVYEHEEWAAVANVFERFFREKMLGVPAEDNATGSESLMPFLPPTELTASTLARLVDRFAGGDLSYLLADDSMPPPCPELASALDAPDAAAIRCHSCTSMPGVRDESCLQCRDLRRFRSQFETLQARFLSYFFWPALLSSEELTNIAPVYATIKRQKKKYQRKRPRRRAWVSERWAQIRMQQAEEEAAATGGSGGRDELVDSAVPENDAMEDDGVPDDSVTGGVGCAAVAGACGKVNEPADDSVADSAPGCITKDDGELADDSAAGSAAPDCALEGNKVADDSVASGTVDEDTAEAVADVGDESGPLLQEACP